MIRNLLYVLLLLAVAAGVFYLMRYRSGGTLDVSEKNFTVSDTAAIARIFIADMKGHTVDLVRNQSQWIMNNRYPARRDATDLMLRTLRTMAVRYPVPDAARKNVIRELSSQHRKVILYDAKGKEIRTIYVGGPPLDNVGNYMVLEGADTPFVVEVPGFQGSLETRFITDTLDMRSRMILAVPFSSLLNLNVRYNDKPDSSFAIDFSDADSFRVYHPLTGESLPRRLVNREKLLSYVNALKEVYCEAFETYNPVKSEILAQRPFCTVTIKLRDGSQRVIDCYRKPVDRRSKGQSEGDETRQQLPYDIDRLYGLVDGKDFVLLQYLHFGRLLKNVDYFKA